jgi:hypothetical protein
MVLPEVRIEAEEMGFPITEQRVVYEVRAQTEETDDLDTYNTQRNNMTALRQVILFALRIKNPINKKGRGVVRSIMSPRHMTDRWLVGYNYYNGGERK